MGRGVSLWIACLLVLAVAAGCRRSERAITSPDEAKDARIGVMIGTTGEAIARKRFPEARVKSFDDIMDAVAAMKSGQLDVIITAYPTSLQVVKKNPELGRLPHPLSNEDTAIALRKAGVASGNGLWSRVPITSRRIPAAAQNTPVLPSRMMLRPGRYTSSSGVLYPGAFPVRAQCAAG